MFLGQPEHTPYDVKFNLLGFPVRIHPWFWLMTLFLGMHSESAPGLILWIAAVFTTLMVHEMGHALVMRMYGIHSQIVLYAFGGVTVPVSSYGNRQLRGRDDALISFAGGGLQFCLAALIWGLYVFHAPPSMPGGITGENLWNLLWYPCRTPIEDWGIAGHYAHIFLAYVYLVSIIWGVLNLLPILPLDGGQIAREFFTWLWPRDGVSITLMVSIVISVAIAAWMVMGEMVFNAVLFGALAYSNYQQLSQPRY